MEIGEEMEAHIGVRQRSYVLWLIWWWQNTLRMGLTMAHITFHYMRIHNMPFEDEYEPINHDKSFGNSPVSCTIQLSISPQAIQQPLQSNYVLCQSIKHRFIHNSKWVNQWSTDSFGSPRGYLQNRMTTHTDIHTQRTTQVLFWQNTILIKPIVQVYSVFGV